MGASYHSKSARRLGYLKCFLFFKSLAGKGVWRLLSTSSLWTRVVHHKYIAHLLLVDWVRSENKRNTRSSIIWKAVTLDFDLIGKGIAWRIGDGNRFLVGVDPWLGSGRDHLLSNAFWAFLANRGITFLYHIDALIITYARCQ